MQKASGQETPRWCEVTLSEAEWVLASWEVQRSDGERAGDVLAPEPEVNSSRSFKYPVVTSPQSTPL